MGTTIGIIGLFVAIALLVVLAFKGHSVIIAAPIAALIAVLFSYGLKGHFMASYTITYMSGFANYAKNYFQSICSEQFLQSSWIFQETHSLSHRSVL